MRLHEFSLFEPGVIGARPVGRLEKPEAWNLNAEVIIRAEGDQVLMRQTDRVIQLVPGPMSAGLVQHASNPDVVWLLVRTKPTQVGLKYFAPARATSLAGLRFAVDQRVADDLMHKGRIHSPTIADALTWLSEEFLVISDEHDAQRAFAIVRPRTDDRVMQLLGRSYVADLTRHEDGSISLDRVVNRPRNQILPIALLSGRFEFVDSTNQFQTDGLGADRAILEGATTSYGTYLDLWGLYSKKEWEQEVARAAKISTLRYSSVKSVSAEGGGWTLRTDREQLTAFQRAWRDFATEDDQVEIDEVAPDWNEDRYTDLTTADRSQRVRGTPRFTDDGIDLEVRHEGMAPPESGFVYLSLKGDRTQQERRDRARRAIEAGLGIPTLHRLLQDMPMPHQRQSTLQGLTPYARQSFRSGKPTAKQELAVKVALNTPDVALVIGPPGTGKTQVIAALERRLAELNETHSIAQQVLISSFQHDAVENALERTDVYGLPAVKVGERRGVGLDPFESWRQQQASKVAAQAARMSAEDPAAALLNDLDQSIHELLLLGTSPSERPKRLHQLEAQLSQLAIVARIRPSLSWRSRWDQYRARATTVPSAPLATQRWALSRAVRALRVTAASFADDGQLRALHLQKLTESSDWLTAEDRALLRRLSTTTEPEVPDLIALERLQGGVLDILRGDRRPAAVRNALDADLAQLLGELQAELAEKVSKSQTGVLAVVGDFADALASYPSRVRDAVENYSSIVGATCQQAGSKRMASLRELFSGNVDAIHFQSVIIDEAARANPLDLFIPMAMARRRIVLVGDHRQLPHILDPEIEENIRAERGEQVQSDTYQHSLFERLWRQLKAREANDGVQRVVMLDIQFRMHPTLGNFISRTFYESAGLGRVHSGRSAEDFDAEVPGYGKAVCTWINVPTEAGRDERVASGSRTRLAEAVRIAQEVKQLLSKLPASRSIGVITFYAAQRDLIFKELASLGLAERAKEGWRVKPEYAATPDGHERLRVGTVDSFQGKEFDVVFLSVVRSSASVLPRREDLAGDAEFEKRASSKYGHLRSANRLNVAMSRQKRLLVAVGDSHMFRGHAAAEAVPEMCALLDLCDEEARRGQ